MGYLDEDFSAHVWFAIKFLVVLIVVRVILFFLGFTSHWPVIDDVISIGASMLRDFFTFLNDLFGGFSPRLGS